MPARSLTSKARKTLGRFVPTNLHDPVGLFKRLVSSDHRAARYSLRLAVTGVVASPLDLALLPFEKHLYRQAPAPDRPSLFVVGAPRSGTTLTYQLLIRHFDVRYPTNVTAVFPRSPLTAMRLHEPLFSRRAIGYDSYYGRTTALSGQNDGLQIWDRWFDREVPANNLPLEGEQREGFLAFWGAFEHLFGKPIVNKNNTLIAYAHLVAGLLPQAQFICLDRDPVFLAQSLLLARREIQGSNQIPYGLHDSTSEGRDPVEDVCDQVGFHRRLADTQLEAIGSERFWVVPYEEICADPTTFIQKVAERCRGLGPPLPIPEEEAFTASRTRRIDEPTFRRIEELLSASS